MDSSQLNVFCDDFPYSDAAREAVRAGVRAAVEILTGTPLPERVVLTSHYLDHDGDGSAPWRSGKGAARKTNLTVCRHTHTDVVVSYPAAAAHEYLGEPPVPQSVVLRALTFCSGYGAARYAAAHALASGGAVWLPSQLRNFEGPLEGEQALSYWAGLIATMASGFTMIPLGGSRDPQSEAVTIFLQCAAEKVKREGAAAIWRGAIGKVTLSLMKRVRFSAEPGRVTSMGTPICLPRTLHALIQYTDGRGPWPFIAPGAGRTG